MDIKDRTHPKLLQTFDYTPPYYGGNLGSAHTATPVIVRRGENPNLLVSTDEIVACPAGFGRILDISDMNNPDVLAGKRPSNIQLLTTFRAPAVQDNFDYAKGQFACQPPSGPGSAGFNDTTHLPMQDVNAPSLFYVTWYNQGLRAIDITNPYLPKELGHFVSPRYEAPRAMRAGPGRTDGGGGGLTILRYTGPVPPNPPLPGAR
jgi:hypothetical protein